MKTLEQNFNNSSLPLYQEWKITLWVASFVIVGIVIVSMIAADRYNSVIISTQKYAQQTEYIMRLEKNWCKAQIVDNDFQITIWPQDTPEKIATACNIIEWYSKKDFEQKFAEANWLINGVPEVGATVLIPYNYDSMPVPAPENIELTKFQTFWKYSKIFWDGVGRAWGFISKKLSNGTSVSNESLQNDLLNKWEGDFFVYTVSEEDKTLSGIVEKLKPQYPNIDIETILAQNPQLSKDKNGNPIIFYGKKINIPTGGNSVQGNQPTESQSQPQISDDAKPLSQLPSDSCDKSVALKSMNSSKPAEISFFGSSRYKVDYTLSNDSCKITLPWDFINLENNLNNSVYNTLEQTIKKESHSDDPLSINQTSFWMNLDSVKISVNSQEVAEQAVNSVLQILNNDTWANFQISNCSMESIYDPQITCASNEKIPVSIKLSNESNVTFNIKNGGGELYTERIYIEQRNQNALRNTGFIALSFVFFVWFFFYCISKDQEEENVLQHNEDVHNDIENTIRRVKSSEDLWQTVKVLKKLYPGHNHFIKQTADAKRQKLQNS